MKKFLFAALCLALAACGPKDVGEGASSALPVSSPAQDLLSQARYPMDGNRIQQRLYVLNQPQVIETMQQRQKDLLRRGAAPSGYENLTPKQASPFRQ